MFKDKLKPQDWLFDGEKNDKLKEDNIFVYNTFPAARDLVAVDNKFDERLQLVTDSDNNKERFEKIK